jgi:HD-GYP domain-containing protein (c-di-GMP phosphodiesterase class II)
LNAVFHHHENFDGSGYPDRLKGDEISLNAQILRVVDSYSAMLGNRPYSNPRDKSIQRAVTQIELGSGALYSPVIVKMFLTLMQRPELYCSSDKGVWDFHRDLFLEESDNN